MWRVLIVLVVVSHFAYLAFLPAGGYVAWWRPRFIAVHLAALFWALLSITLHLDCPLTNVQDWLERESGHHPSGQFVDRYVKGYVIPHGHDTLVQAVIALAVVVAYVGVIRRWRARRAAGAPVSGEARSRAA